MRVMASAVMLSAERYAILLYLCVQIILANQLKYEFFTAADKSRWIQVGQLEGILSDLQGTLGEINEKQKQDSILVSQAINTLQSINVRLQNVENQLSRIESSETYVKGHLQQSNENSIKEELRVEQIGYKMEKNHQQVQTHLNEVESNVEKIFKKEENIEKKIQRIETNQNQLAKNIDQLQENTKRESSKIIQNITNSQHQIRQSIEDTIQNTTKEENIKVVKIQEFAASKVNSTTTKPVQNDITQTELLTCFSSIDNKYNDLAMQMAKLETNMLENTGVVNKIYNGMDQGKDDIINYLGSQLDSYVLTMKHYVTESLQQLETKFKRNFEAIINEQISFRNNCHRLQLNEEQLEDKAIEILQKLFNYIDNRTQDMRQDLDYLRKYEDANIANQTNQIEELKNTIRSENEKSMQEFRNATNYMSSLTRNVDEFGKNVTRIEDTLIALRSSIEDLKNRTNIRNMDRTEIKEFYDARISKIPTNNTRTKDPKIFTITALPDSAESKMNSESLT